MQPVVSILMPVYNAEPYIAEAIQSVLAQSFTGWELLIGDDYSTDDTLAVCRSFAKRDGRIRIIPVSRHHGQANGVRQELLAHIGGQWVHELDADDMIDGDVLQSLLQLARNTQADAVTQRSVCMAEDGKPLQEAIPANGFNFDRVYSGIEACRLTVPGWRINMNGGLFRPELLRQAEADRLAFVASVGFTSTLIYDDELLSRFVLKRAHRVAVSPAVYWRREASGSVTRQYGLRLFHHVQVQRLVALFAERWCPELVEDAELNLWWKIVAHTCQYEYHKKSLPVADRESLNRLISQYWHGIDNSKIRHQLPLWRSWLMTYSYPLFRTFIAIRCLIR